MHFFRYQLTLFVPLPTARSCSFCFSYIHIYIVWLGTRNVNARLIRETIRHCMRYICVSEYYVQHLNLIPLEILCKLFDTFAVL